jgi:cell wall-associated NlpC family hydrolase
MISLGLFSACSSTIRYTETEQTQQTQAQIPVIQEPDTVVVADTTIQSQEETNEPMDLKTYELVSSFPEINTGNGTSLDADFANMVDKMKMVIIKYKDTRYVYGGTSLNGIDCSGFTGNVYAQAYNIKLPRSARDQYYAGPGEKVDQLSDLKFGDLVFFDTGRRVVPGHVGIYLGEYRFVHASSKRGVIVSPLDDGYYNRAWVGGKRIISLH